jgi:hypothetical protein
MLRTPPLVATSVEADSHFPSDGASDCGNGKALMAVSTFVNRTSGAVSSNPSPDKLQYAGAPARRLCISPDPPGIQTKL